MAARRAPTFAGTQGRQLVHGTLDHGPPDAPSRRRFPVPRRQTRRKRRLRERRPSSWNASMRCRPRRTTPGLLYDRDSLHIAVHRLWITGSHVAQNVCSHRHVHPMRHCPADAHSQVGATIPTASRARKQRPAVPCSGPRTARQHATDRCSDTVNTVIRQCCVTASPLSLPGQHGGCGRARHACPGCDTQTSQARTGRPRRPDPAAPTERAEPRRPADRPRCPGCIRFHGPRKARPAPVACSSDARTACRHAATTCGNAAVAGIMPGWRR